MSQNEFTSGGGGNDGSGDSGDGGGGGVSWSLIAPDWVKDLKDLGKLGTAALAFLVAFAEDPIGTLQDIVLDVVLSLVLGAIIDVLADLIDLVLQAANQAASTPVLIARGLIQSGAATGNLIFKLTAFFGELAAGMIAAAGPFGPIVAFGLAAVVVYVGVEGAALLVDIVAPTVGDWLRGLRGLGR